MFAIWETVFYRREVTSSLYNDNFNLLNYSFNKLWSWLQRETFPSNAPKKPRRIWLMTRSDNEPTDQLFVYFVALELWPWSHAWPWPLYAMCLGRHGQLASLILLTFHMFDSVFNPIFLFVYPMLWMFIIWSSSFGWHACTVCLIILCTIHLVDSDEAFRSQRPLPFFLARVGLSAFVVFLFWTAGSWG